MVLNLNRLINNFIENIDINETIIFNDEYLKNTDIRKLSEIIVNGTIISTDENLYVLKLTIKGEMILPCSVTLEDVVYHFEIKIDDIISENDENDENYIKITNNSIDIMPIIWQNIVMEIPLKVVSPNIDRMKYEGDGWRLMTDEERNKTFGNDSRLKNLNDLLDN